MKKQYQINLRIKNSIAPYIPHDIASGFSLWKNSIAPYLYDIGFTHLSDMKVLGTDKQVAEFILTYFIPEKFNKDYKDIEVNIKEIL
jgi:hypothetical protein